MPSRYGKAFDERVDEWARLENAHDKMHPNRSDCGGVGGCPMMMAAVENENALMDWLNEWRVGLGGEGQ